ncbi:hypothetical protein FQN60_012084 [Etheostoma spectabile]|uniref:GTPase IMAP family member 8 n=1 Tax=Etheostoma spectabile TaxID=54343 RepID=A0A5J5DNV2_9PERO|nr:hypothetical protein FQN60_012084 [Etheostoma spectabile]
MDGEAGPVCGGSQREKKRSCKDLMMEVEELEEPDSDFEECITKKLYKVDSGSALEASPSSMLEYWVYPENQHSMADCPITKTITSPATPVTHRPCPFIPVSSSVAAVDSTVCSVVIPMMSSPISSMCSPISSALDTLSSTSTSPGCADQDPVSAAAHLHLLGESLSLIGHHLQETNKMVSMSSSLSLLLDSLLCALAPLICLTAQIPELRSCTQHTLASTLGNIAYVMPGFQEHRNYKLELLTHAAMNEHLRGSYYGSSPPELRLVLLGNIGCGKTSSADTILGQLSPVSPSDSRSCQLRRGITESRSVTVVEAPRWYWDCGKMEDSVRKETERAMTLVAPGPHAVLLLVPVNQFTEMESHVPAELAEAFGDEVLDHTLVLLTCGDYLMGRTVEEYLQKEHPGLRQIIERCRGRYHVFNNRKRQDREQVCELLEKVDNMVKENGEYYVKTAQERELEKRVKDRKRELLESYRAQKEERKETVSSMHIQSTEIRRGIDREEKSAAWERRRREGREEIEGNVAVVDTPDWFCSEQTPDEVRAQISSCVALTSPGPHAFLLCVPLDQPAKTELQALRVLEAVFGPEAVQRHTLLLFTHADKLKKSGKAGNCSVEEYIAGQRGDLVKLVEKCGDRFHVMEMEGGGRDRRNVAQLLEKVEQTVKEGGGQCYSHPAFQEAENRVRKRQLEIARERRGGGLEQKGLGDRQLSSERQVLYPYMQPLAEAEEEVTEDEIEKTRDEAEMSVSTLNIDSLPPITHSTMSPSLLRSIMEKMESSAKMLPQLLADSSVWVGEGAKKVKDSPVWETVSGKAQNVQKMVVDSSVWEKVGANVGHVSKLVGDRVPKEIVDGSSWVGSRAKSAAASPMWGKVGSGAKTGAKLMADGSVQVGARLFTGAKMVSQSPVWGKVGSGAKAGAKMVAESSVWGKIGTTAKQVPMVVIGGALLGLVLGVILGGVIGGAVGVAAGSAVTEVGRRKISNKNMLEKTDNVERTVNDSIDSLQLDVAGELARAMSESVESLWTVVGRAEDGGVAWDGGGVLH